MVEPVSIPLGRFLLDDVVGSGGAGIVWRARHRKLELPVAVKVLPRKADRLALHAHKNEVQAVARLHHPHIVALLDAGLVDDVAASAAAAARQEIAAGSPWLAIELASAGDLARLRPPLPWPVISDILRSLLGALAHAHARGVIHKDLKPQNVLLCTIDDVRPGIKLTDFGLAQADDRADRLDGGTPLFMAPEQFDIDGRDLGPGTDLYALGCLTHWLATGAPPFVDGSWHMLAARHIEEQPRPLPPSDAPDGLSAWMLRLLEKSPARRYRCAADADQALAALDAQRAPPPSDRLPEGVVDLLLAASIAVEIDKVRPDDATVLKAGGATEIAPDRDVTFTFAAAPPSSGAPAAMERSAGSPSDEGSSPERSNSQTQQPPLDVGAASPPRSWRAGARSLVDLRLVEAGLSLWGLRPVPLVGRDMERDLLWDALLAVHERRAPRAVVVRGPSGVGKSRVTEWIVHRAKETGAALSLQATFQPVGGRDHGLTGMVARHARFPRGGGDDDTIAARSAADAHAQAWLGRWLPGADLSAPELCALAGRQEGVFASGEERHAALVRLLVARARERPLIVWLDDVQHGMDALALVARVIADAPELAALFVITAVDELLNEDARARLDELVAHPSTTQIELLPLEEQAHDELCGRLLGGEAGGLTDQLRRRTEGNPLFAVHLVGDWIARGLLEVTDDGLALRAGTLPELPDALHALWATRIETAIADERGKRALEVAAVLGSAVDLIEWQAAVGAQPALAGVDLDDVVDDLAGAGLARRSESGFLFTHAMVRSSVERRAREAGRAGSHHACVATALSSLWGTETSTAAARIGRHLLAAGAPMAALPPLLIAARAALAEGDVLEASAVLADWQRACVAVELDDDDARVAPGLLLRALVAQHDGRHQEARTLAGRAVRGARDDKKQAEALRAEAAACVALALLDDAEALYHQAHGLSARLDDELGVGLALRGLGDVAYFRGDKQAASARYTAVAAVFAAHGKKSDLVASLWSLGYVEMERGAYRDAERLFIEQRTISRATRDRLGEANAENALGELARRRSALDEAEHHYRQAARLASKSGLARRWTFRLNLAHVRVERGDLASARVLASELLSSNAAKEPLVAAAAWWILACDAAARGDLTTYDRCSGEAIAVGPRAIVELDLAKVAQHAGDLIAVHDQARAQKAWVFANEKWKQLGRTP